MSNDDDIEETRVSAGLILKVTFGDLPRIKAQIAAIEGINIVYQKVSIGRLKIVADTSAEGI